MLHYTFYSLARIKRLPPLNRIFGKEEKLGEGALQNEPIPKGDRLSFELISHISAVDGTNICRHYEDTQQKPRRDGVLSLRVIKTRLSGK